MRRDTELYRVQRAGYNARTPLTAHETPDGAACLVCLGSPNNRGSPFLTNHLRQDVDHSRIARLQPIPKRSFIDGNEDVDGFPRDVRSFH